MQIENKQARSNGHFLDWLEVLECFLTLDLVFKDYIYILTVDYKI